jgi:hypothetical protein
LLLTREAADLKVLRNLAHKTLEGELPDEKLSRLLVTTNLAERDSSGTEAMGLLHTTGSGLENIAEVGK